MSNQKTERLFLPITPKDKQIIKDFCKEHYLVMSRYIVDLVMKHIREQDQQ